MKSKLEGSWADLDTGERVYFNDDNYKEKLSGKWANIVCINEVVIGTPKELEKYRESLTRNT